VFVSIEKWGQKFRKLFPYKRKSIFWIPVPSNINYYDFSQDQKNRLRNQLDFSSKDIVVSVFSPLGSGKLFEEIIKTWKTVREKRNNVKLMLIGISEKDIVNYKLEFEDDLYFTGYVSEKKVAKFLSISDIYLIPFADGISSRRASAIAAMLYGLPTITTKERHTDSIFHNSPIIIVDRPDQLADKVLYFIDNKQARIKIGKGTRKFYEKHFDLYNIKEKFMNYIQK